MELAMLLAPAPASGAARRRRCCQRSPRRRRRRQLAACRRRRHGSVVPCPAVGRRSTAAVKADPGTAAGRAPPPGDASNRPPRRASAPGASAHQQQQPPNYCDAHRCLQPPPGCAVASEADWLGPASATGCAAHSADDAAHRHGGASPPRLSYRRVVAPLMYVFFLCGVCCGSDQRRGHNYTSSSVCLGLGGVPWVS